MTTEPIFSISEGKNYYYLYLFDHGYSGGDSAISKKIKVPFSVYFDYLTSKCHALPYSAKPSNIAHELTFCIKDDAEKALEWVKSCYMTLKMNGDIIF